MSHSWYVCHKSARFCYEYGKHMSDSMQTLLTDLNKCPGIDIQEFIQLGQERFSVCEQQDVIDLYLFIVSIPVEDFAIIYHEDILFDFFELHNTYRGALQIGSLYNNNDTYMFNGRYDHERYCNILFPAAVCECDCISRVWRDLKESRKYFTMQPMLSPKGTVYQLKLPL